MRSSIHIRTRIQLSDVDLPPARKRGQAARTRHDVGRRSQGRVAGVLGTRDARSGTLAEDEDVAALRLQDRAARRGAEVTPRAVP
jgi:hypothetical protein